MKRREFLTSSLATAGLATVFAAHAADAPAPAGREFTNCASIA